MQEDTDLVEQIRDYIQLNPFLNAYDVVKYFESKGVPERKVLYILREIYV